MTVVKPLSPHSHAYSMLDSRAHLFRATTTLAYTRDLMALDTHNFRIGFLCCHLVPIASHHSTKLFTLTLGLQRALDKRPLPLVIDVVFHLSTVVI